MASTLRPPSSQTNASPLSVGTLVAGITGGIVIVTITGLIAAPLVGIGSLSADARLWTAYAVLLGVGLLSGFVVAIWKAPAGLAAAGLAGVMAALLLWLMRIFLLEGGPYNRLILGPIGLVTALVTATVGGWLAHLLDGGQLRNRVGLSGGARVGLWAASLWLSFEMVGRMVGGGVLGPEIDNRLVGDMLGALVGMLIAALVISRYGQAHGISVRDWEYRWTPKTIGIGIVAGLLAIGLMTGTAFIDAALWTMPGDVMSVFANGLRSGAWVAVLLLAVNAGVAPVCEEIAWRGVVQTAFVRAWGSSVGVGVTMVLFAMKHVVLDGTLARLTTLLMLGLVFGIVRHRCGTGSSTVTHVAVNVYSTVYLVTSV